MEQDSYMHIGIPHTVDSAPDHRNKVRITIKHSTQIFGFPVHIKIMFTLWSIKFAIALYLKKKKKDMP